MAKRGRPIKWGKAFEKYKSTAQFYTNRADGILSEDYINDVDTFKEQVMGLRDTYGWGVEKATSALAQRAGLNGASLKQVRMMQFYHLVQTGEDLSFEDAVYAFSPKNRETEDVLKMAKKLEITTEDELQEKGIIATDFGEDLSWEYLTWVRSHPVSWHIPTEILYGSEDNLQSMDTVKAFAAGCGAGLTVMEHGEHWFHTEEQLQFLREWLIRCEK